jgi:hypothetical protein
MIKLKKGAAALRLGFGITVAACSFRHQNHLHFSLGR